MEEALCSRQTCVVKAALPLCVLFAWNTGQIEICFILLFFILFEPCESIVFFKIKLSWRDGSVVKYVYCFSRGPELSNYVRWVTTAFNFSLGHTNTI